MKTAHVERFTVEGVAGQAEILQDDFGEFILVVSIGGEVEHAVCDLLSRAAAIQAWDEIFNRMHTVSDVVADVGHMTERQVVAALLEWSATH